MTFGTNTASASASSRRFLVHVHDGVGGFERANAIEARRLRAAHPRNAPDALAWMDAERRAADYPVPGAEIEQELGDARHQGHDPRVPRRRLVHRARRVAKRARVHQPPPA